MQYVSQEQVTTNSWAASPPTMKIHRQRYYKQQAMSLYGSVKADTRNKKKGNKKKPKEIRAEREKLWYSGSADYQLPVMYADTWRKEERRSIAPIPVPPRKPFQKIDCRQPVCLPVLDNLLSVPMKPSTAKSAARLWMSRSGEEITEEVISPRDPFDTNCLSSAVFETKCGYPHQEFDTIPLMLPATTPTRNPDRMKTPRKPPSRSMPAIVSTTTITSTSIDSL